MAENCATIARNWKTATTAKTPVNVVINPPEDAGAFGWLLRLFAMALATRVPAWLSGGAGVGWRVLLSLPAFWGLGMLISCLWVLYFCSESCAKGNAPKIVTAIASQKRM